MGIDYELLKKSAEMAAQRVIEKGADDIFKPPAFSLSTEHAIIKAKPQEFFKEAVSQAIKHAKVGD